MWLSEVLTGNMTYDQAVNIFAQLGVDPTGMDSTSLKAARKRLIMQHHTDLGCAPGIAQNINAAFDVLSQGGPQIRNTRRPTASSYDAGDSRYGQWYGGNRGGHWGDEQPEPQRNDEDRYPIWAQAGWS